MRLQFPLSLGAVATLKKVLDVSVELFDGYLGYYLGPYEELGPREKEAFAKLSGVSGSRKEMLASIDLSYDPLQHPELKRMLKSAKIMYELSLALESVKVLLDQLEATAKFSGDVKLDIDVQQDKDIYEPFMFVMRVAKHAPSANVEEVAEFMVEDGLTIALPGQGDEESMTNDLHKAWNSFRVCLLEHLREKELKAAG